jgi:hypothetical protein
VNRLWLLVPMIAGCAPTQTRAENEGSPSATAMADIRPMPTSTESAATASSSPTAAPEPPPEPTLSEAERQELAKSDIETGSVTFHPYKWELVRFAAPLICKDQEGRTGGGFIRIQNGKVVEFSVEEEVPKNERAPEQGMKTIEIKIPGAAGKPIAPVPPELAPLFRRRAAFSWSCL